MASWDGWPLERLLYIFIGVAYLLVWGQVTLYHWKGGFHNKFMWGPVLYTPLLVIIALVHGFVRGQGVETVFVLLFAIGVLEGLFGLFAHLKGIAKRVGGFNLQNLMSGPPFSLPIMYAALSGLGLLVHYWPHISGSAS